MRLSLLIQSLLGTLLLGGVMTLLSAPALADPPPRGHPGYWGDRHDGSRHRPAPPGHDRHHGYRPRPPAYPYRDWHRYPGRRHYHYRGDDFFGWLAFTAVSLAVIDSLNEQQQREHERVMRRALRAPVGETIQWDDGRAGGSVTTLREGTSSYGRYCREYTQDVRIGGREQQVYGTACRNADGSWEIVE